MAKHALTTEKPMNLPQYDPNGIPVLHRYWFCLSDWAIELLNSPTGRVDLHKPKHRISDWEQALLD